jgi:hypothetical protein
MAHINEETLYQRLLDGSVLSDDEEQHLADCVVCQAQWAAVQTLGQELQIAKASAPSPAALNRYFGFFDQVEQALSLAQRFTAFITAQLQWDGRRQPAWQGVRNTQIASYRLLYGAKQVEIELLVAPREGRFQIEGEVVPLTEPTTLLPARCELQDMRSAETIDVTECQASGRFHLGNVPTGRYRLCFVPTSGPTIVIDELELQ